MKYNYYVGAKKRRINFVVIPIMLVMGGMYIALNSFWPEIGMQPASAESMSAKLTYSKPVQEVSSVYIPKINLDVAIVPTNGDENAALLKGAVQRKPESGNPKDGGNYIIAAHRFNLGLTPSGTKARSPFYHIDKLIVGDDIYIDYAGERYAYKVTERKNVLPNAVEIEQNTADNRLTLYSCELAGQKAGREVVIAKLTGKVEVKNGKPVVKPVP